jgi:hypothetical protein
MFSAGLLPVTPCLLGLRVEPLVGVPDVDRGDHKGRHELQDAQHQGNVDIAPQLGRHESVRVVGQQHVDEVPDKEQACHREDEPAQPPPQLDEIRTGLHLGPVGGLRSFS